MKTELLQNSDVLLRVLLLVIPTIIVFLAAVIYLLRSKRNEENAGADREDLKSAVMLFLPVYITNVMYSVMMVFLLFVLENSTVDKINGVSVAFFAAVSLLCAASCAVKGIIGGARLPYCTGAEKQNGLSKSLLYLAVAEMPGLIAFALYMIKFVINK